MSPVSSQIEVESLDNVIEDSSDEDDQPVGDVQNDSEESDDSADEPNDANESDDDSDGSFVNDDSSDYESVTEDEEDLPIVDNNFVESGRFKEMADHTNSENSKPKRRKVLDVINH